MAVIKIPYEYTEYPYSPFATFVSKHTHKPSSCLAIGTTIGIIVLIVGVLIYNATDKGEGFFGAIANILLVIGFLSSLTSGFWVPRLSDKLKIAERIAKG